MFGAQQWPLRDTTVNVQALLSPVSYLLATVSLDDATLTVTPERATVAEAC